MDVGRSLLSLETQIFLIFLCLLPGEGGRYLMGDLILLDSLTTTS
jgi:hypothetical protein